MTRPITGSWPWLLVLPLLAAAAPASPQVFTGRIEATVSDATGGVLPGVVVEITGPQKATFVTGRDGVAHFLNLEPGTYQVRATLQGFQDYRNTEVPVVAGGTVPLRISLKIAGLEEQVVVIAESPVIDPSKTTTATSITNDELQNIPSSRDPWVVMQTVPAIVVDRVNVGGAEAGYQSLSVAKGASLSDNSFNMDGIPITDMAAIGRTPTYYDFDMFQEINVTTGGSDLTSSTGGTHLNFILKAGTNAFHGSSRVYFEDQSMQSNNMDPALAAALGSPDGKGNRIGQYADYGFEVGGPLIKDRLWAWGSLGKTDARVLAITQTPERIVVKNGALKVQGQLTPGVRAGFTYFSGNKLAFGRGASATHPPETTVDQRGPTPFYKGEVNVVLGHSVFLKARGAYLDQKFVGNPQGGMNKDIWVDDGGVWHGSANAFTVHRPQQTLAADASYFHGRHELKFGFSWRRVTTNSASQMSSASGHDILSYWNGYPAMFAYVRSPYALNARAYYTNFWVGDTITRDRLTLNLGLRVDRQADGMLATSEPAVPGFEQFLPAVSGPAIPDAIVWKSASPRISATYALDKARKTLLRGSYAMLASQLGNGTSSQISVVSYRYIVFDAVDTNANGIADYNEVDLNAIEGWVGFDITDPGKLTTINQIKDYKVPKTHEVILGFDRELIPNLGISAAFTWRRMVDFNWYPRIGVTRADYVQTGTLKGSGLPDGSSYSVPYYALDPTRVPDIVAAQGTVYTGQNGYHQRFMGLEVAATKRMSDRWMGRFGFSTNTHREFFDDPNTSITDPTPSQDTPYVNGGLVITRAGHRSPVFMIPPKYQVTANGYYEAPLGIDLGGNMVLRQGFGQPWFQSLVATGDPLGNRKNVLLITDIDKNRLPTVATFDLRVGWNPSKAFNVSRVGFTIYLDIFNLFNSGTVLARQYDKRRTGPTGFNQVLEIMNPRILRLGARVTF